MYQRTCRAVGYVGMLFLRLLESAWRKRMQRLGHGRYSAFGRVGRFYANRRRVLRVLVEEFNGDERGLEVDRCGKGHGRIVAGQQTRDMSSLYKRSGCPCSQSQQAVRRAIGRADSRAHLA